MSTKNAARKPVVIPDTDRPRAFRVVKPDSEPVTPQSGLRKIALGAIKPATISGAPTHDALALSPESNELLEQFVAIEPEFKSLKNQREALSKQIAPLIKTDYFRAFNGRGLPAKSPKVAVAGRNVLLVFSEKYTTLVSDDSKLNALLGAQFVGDHFRQATDIKIELDKLSDEKAEAFAAALIALAQSHGATEAISAKQYIKPRGGFHAARTTLLDAERNIALDGILPITAFPKLQ